MWKVPRWSSERMIRKGFLRSACVRILHKLPRLWIITGRMGVLPRWMGAERLPRLRRGLWPLWSGCGSSATDGRFLRVQALKVELAGWRWY